MEDKESSQTNKSQSKIEIRPSNNQPTEIPNAEGSSTEVPCCSKPQPSVPLEQQPQSSATPCGASDSTTTPDLGLEKRGTIKQIISEILDYTLIPNEAVEGGEAAGVSNALTKVFSELDAKANSRPQCTVKDILGEILDCTICKKNARRESLARVHGVQNRPNEMEQGLIGAVGGPGASRALNCQSEICVRPKEFNIYKYPDSASADAVDKGKSTHSLKSLNKLLPSYSTVLKLGPPSQVPFPIGSSSENFIPPIPPPRYEHEFDEMFPVSSLISSDVGSAIFGPDPMYLICPRCRIIVITQTTMQNSALTHLMAFALCMFFCWPFCILPYVMRAFNYTAHYCPYCNHYFGTYTPF